MTHNQHDTQLRDMAGEYVLGTMQGEERTQFEQLLAADVGLQAEVSVWEEKLSPMLDLVEPIVPPAAVWSQIQDRIEPKSTTEKGPGFWESLTFWRNLGMVAATLVLGLGLTLFGMRPEVGLQRVMMIAGQNSSQVQWVVGTTDQTDMLRVKAVAPPELEPGQVCQLWMENPDGTLRPIGVLPHDGSMSMKMPAKLGGDSRFKISIESADKLPTKKPTNKFVFEGGLTKI